MPYDPAQGSGQGDNATAATRQQNFNRFDFCPNEIDQEDQANRYADPAGYAGRHRDYLQVGAGRIVILPGETGETIAVDVNDDCLYEPNQKFKVELFDENADVTLLDDEAVGTIISDDDRPYLGFLSDASSSGEPVAPATEIAVDLDLGLYNTAGPPSTSQRIVSGVAVDGSLSTADGTAESTDDGLCTADYQALTASQGGQFDIAALASGAKPQVLILDDDVNEPNETFTVRIGSLTGARLGAGQTKTYETMTITINDDDPEPYLHLVEPDDGTADRVYEVEEDVGTVSLAVRLHDDDSDVDDQDQVGSGFAVPFTYSVRGVGARAPGDFTDPGTPALEIDACESGTSLGSPVTITIIDDDCREGDEEFIVSLNPSNSDSQVDSRPTPNVPYTLTVRILNDTSDTITGTPACP